MDYGFIRFYNSLAQDLLESNATAVTRYDDVHLSPDEYYVIIPNKAGGIVLTATSSLFIVDCDGSEIAELTEVTIQSLGSGQLAIEIKPNAVYLLHEQVHLRLDTDRTNPNAPKYYSNPIIYSRERLSETLRFDFKHSRALNGTPYEILNVYAGIRVKMWFERPETVKQVQDYVTLTGLKVSAREIVTQELKCVADFISHGTYLALNHAFGCDHIYVNGVRVSNKPTMTWGDTYAIDFNQKKAETKLSVNYDDTRSFASAQITPGVTANVTVTTPKSISFSLTTIQVADPLEAFYELTEAFFFGGYSNSQGFDYDTVTLTALPTNGQFVVNGVVIDSGDLPLVISLADIQAGLVRFYPTGLANGLPYTSFDTTFEYFVTDVNGNDSNGVVVNLSFDTVITLLTNPIGYDFDRTTAQITNPATAYETLTEATMYGTYASENEFPYDDIIITSIPTLGELSVNGAEITSAMLPCTVPLSEISAGNFAFWATKVNGSGPFTTYTTSFNYKILNTNGEQSASIGFVINFTALQ